jgi:hypothetical protein
MLISLLRLPRLGERKYMGGLRQGSTHQLIRHDVLRNRRDQNGLMSGRALLRVNIS